MSYTALIYPECDLLETPGIAVPEPWAHFYFDFIEGIFEPTQDYGITEAI